MRRVEADRMERKLDIGDTLSRSFAIYREQAGVLLPLAFTLFLLVAVIEDVVASTLVLFPLGLAVGVLAGTLFQGMVVGLVSDVQDGRRDSSVEDLVRTATPVILPLIGVGILAGLGIGLGFLLLIVPGLILMTIWAVVAPVIVVERSGVLAAFGRSRELVRDNGWQVFGVLVCVFLITVIVGIFFAAIAVGIADTVVVRVLFNVIASTLTAPLAALVAAVVYFRLLELKGAATPAPEPPAAPDAPAV